MPSATASQEATQVQETTNYDQFKFMDTNREQKRGHIDRLKQAFEEIGNLTRVQPILVNERMEIIDGQHRFTACKELGQPIYYTQVPGLSVREARSMNILHRGWTADDYAKSYALGGDPNYQKYVQLREDYGFNHSVLLAYIYPGTSKGNFRAFRDGELSIPDEAELRRRLDKLAMIGEFTNMVTNREFAIALLKVSAIEGYDHDRMVNKIRLHGDAMLKRYNNLMDNMRMLEEIYNYGSREANRLRLY